jgi:hypothetical protein
MIVLSLVDLSAQALNKQPLFSGLSDLDFSFLEPPRRRPTSLEGDKTLCYCNEGAQPQSVYTVKYYGSHYQSVVLCICPDAVMSTNYMIDTMGKVPYAIRLNDKAMISATTGTCGGAASSGDVINFCGENMHVTVFIHESAHSFDKGKSGSQEWIDAVTKDSCVPDPYANTNYVEDFAQMVVTWVYIVGKGLDKNLGGNQFSCMKYQLELMAQYLPASTIKS